MNPRRHCLVLRDTSYWLLVFGLGVWAESTLRSVLCICACVASARHWNAYAYLGERKETDILVARILAAVDLFLGHTPPHIRLFFYAMSGVFYIIACNEPVGSVRGLVNHVFFRYCVFTAGFGCSMSLPIYACVTAVYVMHCCLLVCCSVPAWYLPAVPERCDRMVERVLASTALWKLAASNLGLEEIPVFHTISSPGGHNRIGSPDLPTTACKTSPRCHETQAMKARPGASRKQHVVRANQVS